MGDGVLAGMNFTRSFVGGIILEANMFRIVDVLRWILSGVLLYLVYSETGVWTVVALGLCLLKSEIDGYLC